jgi:hypothetical protein
MTGFVAEEDVIGRKIERGEIAVGSRLQIGRRLERCETDDLRAFRQQMANCPRGFLSSKLAMSTVPQRVFASSVTGCAAWFR